MFHAPYLTVPSGPKSGNNVLQPSWALPTVCFKCEFPGFSTVMNWIKSKLSPVWWGKTNKQTNEKKHQINKTNKQTKTNKNKQTPQPKITQHPYLPWYSVLSSLTYRNLTLFPLSSFLYHACVQTHSHIDWDEMRWDSLEPMAYIYSRYKFQDLLHSDANKNGRITVKCLILLK